MYACQTAAFSFRNQHSFNSNVTDSTPTSPPTHKALDLSAICTQKWEIINNLPHNCVHCSAEFPPKSVVELKDCSIMAYCKKPGACGKSQVLFAGIELKSPIYEQVCAFQAIEHKLEIEDSNEPLDSAKLMGELEMHARRPVTMEDHSPTCAKCGSRYHNHHHDVDQNGWRIARYEAIKPPGDWPVFDSVSGTWSRYNDGSNKFLAFLFPKTMK